MTLLAIPKSNPETTVVAVLYVLAVVIAAGVGGPSSGVTASVLSFLALNFFFTPPLHTFAVASAADLVSLFVFLMAAVVVGVLFSSALHSKSVAELRERETRLLNRLATRLLAGEPTERVLRTFAEGTCEVFALQGCEISTPFVPPGSVIHGKRSGLAEEVPLEARSRRLGVMRLWVDAPTGLDHEARARTQSLAAQLALALEGLRLGLEARRSEIEAQESETKAALFSGVTHDVKTPLAAITASVTSLIEGIEISEDARREHLITIQQEVDRLHRVVNNLLDIARLHAGALIASKAPAAIDEVIESVLGRMRPLLDPRVVEVRLADDLPEVPMDVMQIDRVLTNLIENAIKFSPPTGSISLLAVGNSDGLRVTVSDQGPGVALELRHRIFGPFETGGDAKSGTGLGLAICRAIVLAHGGRLWVSDNPAGGAAFTFELSASQEDDRIGKEDDARSGTGRR